jgi:serine protease Do
MKRISRPMVGVVSAVIGGVAVVAALQFPLLGRETPPTPKFNIQSDPIKRETLGATSYAPVIKKAAPSVVNIYSTRTVRGHSMMDQFPDDPVFRHFFGPEIERQYRHMRPHKEQGLGSGVIVSPDGYILTANHVVEGADDVRVALATGGKEFAAKVVGTDRSTDVAVLKVDAKELPAIVIADSDKLEVGDVVLAIGNPFGVGQTVTMGIVSALDRGGFGINGYEDFIQTDAAINPGNSGGALVDVEGRLIGINTAIFSETGHYEGVGFAVPINMARKVMELIISGGKITRGYLGVLLQDVNPGLAKAFDLADQSGALVGDVKANTPAEKAGIKAGDVIVEFNGKKISDVNNLRLLVSQTAPDSTTTVKLLRDGKEKTLKVTLGEVPDEAQDKEEHRNGIGKDKQNSTDALDGVSVTDLDRRTRRQLDIPADVHGAIVTEVESDSNAAEAGLQRGDVIVEINHQAVQNADDAIELCTKAKGDRILLLVWQRKGAEAGTQYLTVDNTKVK